MVLETGAVVSSRQGKYEGISKGSFQGNFLIMNASFMNLWVLSLSRSLSLSLSLSLSY
jgi:hypothetical protein